MELTEAEYIQKRQEHTKVLYKKKGINDLDNYNGGCHSPRARHP